MENKNKSALLRKSACSDVAGGGIEICSGDLYFEINFGRP
jgi:hypothetical protein